MMPDMDAAVALDPILEVRFMDEGVFIAAIPFAASDYEKRTPIMHEIRKDDLTL